MRRRDADAPNDASGLLLDEASTGPDAPTVAAVFRPARRSSSVGSFETSGRTGTEEVLLATVLLDADRVDVRTTRFVLFFGGFVGFGRVSASRAGAAPAAGAQTDAAVTHASNAGATKRAADRVSDVSGKGGAAGSRWEHDGATASTSVGAGEDGKLPPGSSFAEPEQTPENPSGLTA